MSKDTVENTRKIDINWLMREGRYKSGNSYYNRGITWTTTGVWGESKNSISYDIDLSNMSDSQIKIYYSKTDRYSREKSDVSYSVSLTPTPCYFGNHRYWFTCPGLNCGKRVGSLYLGEKYFLCRHCLNLSYESRNDSKRFRALGKIFNYDRRSEDLAKILWGKHGRLFYDGVPTKRYKKYLELNFLNISNNY